MDEELKRFMRVWICALISVIYCYYIPTRIKAGVLRFLSLLPPICTLIFVLLPMFFSSTGHYSFTVSFFMLSLATSKLILFVFDKGPLFPLSPNLSQFICLTFLPIRLQQNPDSPNPCFPKWTFAMKVFIFGVLLQVYDYRLVLPPMLLYALYSMQLYLEHEILSMLVNVLVFISTGCNLEKNLNEPYLATSLQDFWGRRWNLIVSVTLRQAVYIPVRRICDGRISSDWGRFLAMLASFIVSGVAHELCFFTLTFERPTGEVSLFFLLHGICTALEVAVKRTRFAKRCVVTPAVSRLITVGFMVVSGGLLFFPTLVRSNVMERRANETLFFLDYIKRGFFTLFGDNC